MSKAESVFSNTNAIVDQNKILLKKLDLIVRLAEKQDEKIEKLTQELNNTKKEIQDLKKDANFAYEAVAQKLETKNKTIVNMDKVIREVKNHEFANLVLHDLNKEQEPFISYMDRKTMSLHIWAPGLPSEKR